MSAETAQGAVLAATGMSILSAVVGGLLLLIGGIAMLWRRRFQRE